MLLQVCSLRLLNTLSKFVLALPENDIAGALRAVAQARGKVQVTDDNSPPTFSASSYFVAYHVERGCA